MNTPPNRRTYLSPDDMPDKFTTIRDVAFGAAIGLAIWAALIAAVVGVALWSLA